MESVVDFAVAAGFLAGLTPEPILTVSEWADAHRILSPKASAEPGPWKTDRAPYLREIQDSLSASNSYEEIICKKGAQLGLTEIGNNWIGYLIHNVPAPTLMVMPTAEQMQRNSEIRIDTMIEATPVLQERIRPARAKDSGNKKMQKDFPGGVLMMAGANSASGLRSMPVRNLYLDEVDGYPGDINGEGSPIDLAEARTRTFRRRKVYKISTPTTAGASIIDGEFESTDQRYFYVPCPHCEHRQKLVWEQIKWDKTAPKKKQPETAYYECINCAGAIQDRYKSRMLAGGVWIPEKPENISRTRVGYHINSLYSPWFPWPKIVEMWLKAQGKIEKLKAFVNTILGECWIEEGEAPEWQGLYERREDFDGETVVPPAVGILTAGADVQKDRIEVEVVGWAKGNESWSLGYYVLLGNPEQPQVWESLADLLNTPFVREDGVDMQIRTLAIDTGYQAQAVYSFAKRYPMDRVIPIKGQDAQRVAISSPQAVQRKLKNGKRAGSTRLVNVGVSILKAELYGWLKLRRNEDGTLPPGYCHFPTRYDEHYFKMLTAEKMVYKADKKGFGKYEWIKNFERNEALDVRVYARAAAIAIGVDRLKKDDWEAMAPCAPEPEPYEPEGGEGPVAAEAVATVVAAAEAIAPRPAKVIQAKPIPKKRSSFWNKS